MIDDRPIYDPDDDQLDRTLFAKHLASGIAGYDNLSPLCIGLTGPWGSGKTSLINMAFSEIEEKKNFDDTAPAKNSVLLVRFNPWNYSDTEQLYRQFFLCLANKISGTGEKRTQKICKALIRLSDEFGSLASQRPIEGPFLLLRHVSKRILRKSLYNSDDLASQKEKISSFLKEKKLRVVVAIDDIDRIPPDQIRLIFRLVATVADFSRMIYLLSFDREVVIKALAPMFGTGKEAMEIAGSYLEKIIQVHIPLPPIDQESIRHIFRERFEKYIGTNIMDADNDENQWLAFTGKEKIIWQGEYWKGVEPYVFKYLHNVRDINRLANVFEFNFQMIGKEVNFVDLLIVTLLGIWEPGLHRWIYDNSQYLLHPQNWKLLYRNSEKEEEIREKIIDNLEMLDTKLGGKQTYDLLCIVFPQMSTGLGRYAFSDVETVSLISKQRIAANGKFHRYFSLMLDVSQISRKEAEHLLQNVSEDELDKCFQEYFQNGSEESLCDEIEVAREKLDVNRVPAIIRALYNSIGSIPYTSTQAFEVTEKLFEMLEADEAEKILKELIDSCVLYNIDIAFFLLSCQGIALGKINKQAEYKKKISSDRWDCFVQAFAAKLDELDHQNNLMFALGNKVYILWRMRKLDDEWYKHYILRKIGEDEVNLAVYLTWQVNIWRGNSSIRYEIDLSVADKELLVQNEEALKAINTVVERRKLEVLSEEQRIKLAGYYLKITAKSPSSIVTEDDCQKQLKIWGIG